MKLTEDEHIEKIVSLLTDNTTAKDTPQYYMMRIIAQKLYDGGCRICEDDEVIISKDTYNNAVDTAKLVCKLEIKLHEIADILHPPCRYKISNQEQSDEYTDILHYRR